MNVLIYITTNWCGDNSVKHAFPRQALSIIDCTKAAPSFPNSPIPMLIYNQLTTTLQNEQVISNKFQSNYCNFQLLYKRMQPAIWWARMKKRITLRLPEPKTLLTEKKYPHICKA